jgi:hypothetical protein
MKPVALRRNKASGFMWTGFSTSRNHPEQDEITRAPAAAGESSRNAVCSFYHPTLANDMLFFYNGLTVYGCQFTVYSSWMLTLSDSFYLEP